MSYIVLSQKQIKQLCSVITIKDIKDYIAENKEDFEKWLQEEQQKENKH